MAAMGLLVGLGNPGLDYAATRHNAGFWLVERWAEGLSPGFAWQQKFQSRYGSLRCGSSSVRLLLPNTFMNRSGEAVVAALQFLKLSPAALWVVHDELDLPPGVVKAKRGGGIAGHNGLRDIVRALGGNQDFWRLRIGIGHPRQLQPGQDVANFVLHRPSLEQQVAIDGAIARALEFLPLAVADNAAGFEQALHTHPLHGRAPSG